MADQRGATAVEYSLLIAMIAAVIIGLVFSIGQATSTGFNTVNETLNSAGG